MSQPAHKPPRLLTAVHAIASVVVLEALRGRMLWLMLILLGAGFAIAQFTAQIAITESDQIAHGVLAFWLRGVSVFVVALFVMSSMLRDWSDKGMELVLALALPRSVYLSGRLAGFGVVAVASAAISTVALMVFIAPDQALIWGTTLAFELLIMVSLSMLCLLTLTHVTLGMSAVAAFYLLARSIDAIRLIAANPISGSTSESHALIRGFIESVAFVLPDLSQFARAEWVIHGNATASDLLYAATQCAIYLALLTAAAMFDLQRKIL
jgi:hypothetical protein